MKKSTSLCSILIAGLAFAVPTDALAKHNKSDCSSKGHHHHSGHSTHVYYGGGSGYRPYCAPRAYYGFGAPAISFGFYSAPAYYGSSGYYNSYPVRTVYRGVPAGYYGGYRGDASDALAVDVQRSLARRGYYRGGIDGDVGPGTRAAIRSYQYNRGLTVTGRIDGALLRSLGLS